MKDIVLTALNLAVEKGKIWPLILVLVCFMVIGPALVSYGGGWFGVNDAMDSIENRIKDIEMANIQDHVSLKTRVEHLEAEQVRDQEQLREIIRTEVKAALFEYYAQNGERGTP